MDADFSSILKEFRHIIKHNSSKDIIDKIVFKLANFMDIGIYIIDNQGFVLKELNEKLDSIVIKVDGKKSIEPQLIGQLSNIDENKINVPLDNLYTNLIQKSVLKNFYGSFLPIFVDNKKLGMIFIFREQKPFEEDEEIIFEYVVSVLGIIIYNYRNRESLEEGRNISNIKSAISTLSYSELEAILTIFNYLKNNEGILITSKVADEAGITRSVVVNALRKFESAGIIEARSLGMKGTHIKIINPYLLNELEKFKK